MTLQVQKTKKPKKAKKLSSLDIWWIRYRRHPSANLGNALKEPSAFLIVGGKGAGKSALAELLASKYTKVIDLYGSRDNEGLAWLRSPFKDSALLLKGNSTEISCNCADVINASDVTLKDLEKYKAIISCSAFYTRIEEEWYSLGKLMSKLWHRTHWTEPWCVVIREASNLIYSRLSLGETQQLAKSYLIYVIREMRHCGFAVALDTIRYHSIDIDFRSIADYIFLKAHGIDGLPRSLRFVYRYFVPSGVSLMAVNGFIVLSRKGPIGCGESICPPWHKEEREDLLNHFDIRIKHSEIPYTAENGMANVSDFEHVRIIKIKIEEKIGMDKLGEKIGRSSRTIHTHIHKHNNMIHAVGECDKCSRVGSKYAKILVD